MDLSRWHIPVSGIRTNLGNLCIYMFVRLFRGYNYYINIYLWFTHNLINNTNNKIDFSGKIFEMEIEHVPR